MNVFIRPNTNYYFPIVYVLKIIEKNKHTTFELVDDPARATILWDHTLVNSEAIHSAFYENLGANWDFFRHEHCLSNHQSIVCSSGKEDVMATVLYMINGLQELQPKPEDMDQFGRFKYTASYQFKHNSMLENVVQKKIDAFCVLHGIKGTDTPSTFFISHDIDTIYGSLTQDGFWSLKNFKIGAMFQLFAYELSRKPHWRNIDKMIRINDEYDVKTTFFWLVNQGLGQQGVKNADYSITKEKELLHLVETSGNTNGLHKSAHGMSINEELEKMPLATRYNRYHFLKFSRAYDWQKISESHLEFDASFGFAEHYGFRNSYGKAFQPYDLVNQKPHDFVEAPLHFMDGTFHKYMKLPTHQIGQTVIDFYEKNKVNCDLSLLWHNTYFTNFKYRSFVDEYKKILGFIYESKITCMTPQELMDKNKLTW